MKKIFITGGCGFIGSHLAEYFARRKYKVIVYDKYNISGNFYNLKKSSYLNKIKVILGDICDLKHLSANMRGVDYVLHLAALIGIPYSYIAPSSYISTNINGTFNVLESSMTNKVKKIIITSTSEVYGSGITFPMTEKHRINCQSPYSATKAAADNLAYSYHCSYGLPVSIIRPFNVFGPRQTARAIIPTIIQQAIYKEIINIGNLNTYRDFTYVQDLCRAYHFMLKQNLFKGEVFNTGTGKCISIGSIVKVVLKNLGINKKIKINRNRLRPIKSEVTKLQASTNKIKKYLNWQPITSFEQGIIKTIEWHKKNHFDENSKFKL